jgi:hypothetical protein
MLTIFLDAIARPRAAILLALLILGRPALAQQVSLALLQPPSSITPSSNTPSPITPSTMEPMPIVAVVQPSTLPETANHRFWDRQNSVLFATSAAFSTADFFVTRANLQSGGQELNPVTSMFGRSTAGLAMNFVGESVGVVGVSYIFHKTGHHKLERAVSMLNIGASATAVTFDLAHR